MKETDPIIVSDHALIRFIERVAGIDLETIRAHIADQVKEAVDAGATSITIDGFYYVLVPERRSVATILTSEQKKARDRSHAFRRSA